MTLPELDRDAAHVPEPPSGPSAVEGALRDELPLPGSLELRALPKVYAPEVLIYDLLYRRRDDPPTQVEIDAHIAHETGEAQSQAGRRRRNLHPYFVIEQVRVRGERAVRYRLTGTKPWVDTGSVSGALRARILSAGRCFYCGKTPKDDGVRLHVDHKVPQAWGGTSHPENLQPLCEECNGGKKDLYRSYEKYADEIRRAISYVEPHVRIGEVLKAFDGEWAPSDVIEFAASAIQHQEDWQKRLRDLRLLGWTIQSTRRGKRGERQRVYYRATNWEPWPPSPVAAHVRKIERERAAAKRASG